MRKIQNISQLICKTGVFISGLLIVIYIKRLLNIDRFWSTFKTMQITMYWFSVAFFFRLGARPIIFIFLLSFVRGFSIIGLGFLLNYILNWNSTIIPILGIWIYFQTLTSSMVKKPYADFTYYKSVGYIHRFFGISKGKLLQEAYDNIMDNISLDTSSDWKYYNWIYFSHKEAKKKDGSGELCATTRVKPHEGWMVFYFENILDDETFQTNLKEIKIMQPYTSLLGMEGTERVAEAIQIYLNKYHQDDELKTLLTYILEEMRQETLIINSQTSPL